MQPIRKRAFYRALKRGEAWAVIEQSSRDNMRRLAESLYADILAPNPFIKLIGISEAIRAKL